MCLSSCWGAVRRNVTKLELVMFFFMFALFMVVITSQELYLVKTCRVNFNQTADICQNLTQSNETRLLQTEIQKFVAELQGYNGLIQSLPAIVFTFFAGPLSDDYGRKPLIVVGFLGYIILNISFFINAWFMDDLGAEYLLFECLQDLFGGDIVFQLGIYAMLVDSTPPENRTRRMSVLQAFMFLGMTAGFVMGGRIKAMFGWEGLYLTSLSLIVLNLVFVITQVKEPPRTIPKELHGPETRAALCRRLTTQCFNTFRNLFKARPNGARIWICTFFLMLNMERFFQAGTYPIHLLFLKIQYGVGMETLGMVFGIFTLSTLLTQLVLIPYISKWLRDTSLILIALLTSIVGYFIFAMGKTVPVLIVAYASFGFYASINACSKSILSKLVEPRETGAVFSAIGITASIASLLSKPFFAFLYKGTVSSLPGTYLLVVVGGLTLVLIPVTFAHRGLKRMEGKQESAKILKEAMAAGQLGEEAKLLEGPLGEAKLQGGPLGEAKLQGGPLGEARLLEGPIEEAKQLEGQLGEAVLHSKTSDV